MNKCMSIPILPNKTSLEHFQKGILISNNSLKMLLEYVNEHYEMKYILTNRLNQDVLEHFFGAIRGNGGGLNDHPSQKQFIYRLRGYLLGKIFSNLNVIHTYYCQNIFILLKLEILNY